MLEQLWKLRPDRDLQCYFEHPSAIAALSSASASGFTLSGCWRQQFDWAVVEWNRDNVFEHPALRNLPDGDLSGIRLSYEESRENCIALDSNLYATVAWPTLRIWTSSSGVDPFYVPLLPHAVSAEGSYQAATTEFELQGSPTVGDYIELAWLSEHYNYRLTVSDTLASAAQSLAQIITQTSPTASAVAVSNRIILSYDSSLGANADRIGAYGTVHGAETEAWQPQSQAFAGGRSPTKWRIDLDFSNLHDIFNQLVPTSDVRKMRWTWAAAFQPRDFQRSEFRVVVTNWAVTGSHTTYAIAGPGSRRIEDDSTEVRYSLAWTESRGNYSGGSIRHTTTPGAKLLCTYAAPYPHRFYLGTRRAEASGPITVRVDGGELRTLDLQLVGEDVLVRVNIGEMSGNASHSVEIAHAGEAGKYFYFDFLEIAVPSSELPDHLEIPDTTLATDWDTDHSIAIAPERTAWLLRKLGFTGRANHYVGALWFYELNRIDHVYASATIEFTGTPEWSRLTQLSLGPTFLEHLNLIGDTSESLATCFALLINNGSTGVWAEATGPKLKITSRIQGVGGNGLAVSVNTSSSSFSAAPVVLGGGVDGRWVTDLSASPRINRAARDWSRSYYRALDSESIEVTAAFSMELQHGDTSLSAGIAQRYPDGLPVLLNTPAVQTNFSPISLAFWQQVYADMAQVMLDAGIDPYLQFGEVQWWYFGNPSGMPLYDDYTQSSFMSRFGRAMRVVQSRNSDPEQYTEEMQHMPSLIGQFTDAIIGYVRASHPTAIFEVLYPPDVNDTALNRRINLPPDHWTPQVLQCLKTENFTFTGDRRLDKAQESIDLPQQLGFPPVQSSHLVGIGEYTTPWRKEHRMAQAQGLESIVLFALDQFCLIGYGLPIDRSFRRATFQGA